MLFKQKNLLSIALTIFGITVSTASFATPKEEATTKCLVESTSLKDRKELAKWMFIAIAAHPEMRELTRITDETTEKSSRKIGELVSSLVTDKCPLEMKALIKESGSASAALQTPFKLLGELAITELMNDSDVTSRSNGFLRYIDENKVLKFLK